MTVSVRIAGDVASTASQHVRIAYDVGFAPEHDYVWDGTSWVEDSPDPGGPPGPPRPPTPEPVDDNATSDPPSVIVEFDCAPIRDTSFVLGKSKLGGGQRLAATDQWVDVSASGVVAVTITRGKTPGDPDGPIQPGACTIQCDNALGDFDPAHAQSPYNNRHISRMSKGMRVRVSVLYPPLVVDPTPIYTGVLQNIAVTRGWAPTATFTCLDDLTQVANTQVKSYDGAVRAGEKSGDRAAWVLSLAALKTDPTISPRLTKPLLPTYGGQAALAELGDIGSAEQGVVFADVNNSVTVTAHGDQFLKTPAAVLSDTPTAGRVEFDDLTTDEGRQTIVNSAIVHAYNEDSAYPDIIAADGASIDAYGRGAIAEVTAPLQEEADRKELARFLATRFSSPGTTIDRVLVEFGGQGNAGKLVLADLFDQATVLRTSTYQRLGASVSIALRQVIEGFAWSWTQNDGLSCELALSRSSIAKLFGSAGRFILGRSKLGGPDRLAGSY